MRRGGQKDVAQVAEQGKVLRSKQVGNTRVVEYAPQTMAAGGQYASGAVATVKTDKAFYKEVRKNLLKGKTSFSILYKGSTDARNLGLYDNILAQIRKLDDKSTSSDGDYLANNIYQIAWSSYRNYKGTTMTFDIIYWETASQTKAVTKKAKSALKKLKVSNMSGIARVKALGSSGLGAFTVGK